jgi:hypothetical protein
MANNNRKSLKACSPHHQRCWAVNALLSILLLGVWTGCQGPSTHTTVTWPAPIQPTWTADEFSPRTKDSQAQPNRNDGSGRIEAMVLSYLNTGRQFTEPDPNDTKDQHWLPEGYVLRVIPLDCDYNVIPVDNGQLIISLYPAVADADARPLMNWVVPSDRLKAYWTRTHLLDGYLLRLAWEDQAPECGDYVLSVTMRYAWKTGYEQNHETIYFSDTAGRP